MIVPTKPIRLLINMYRETLPAVHRHFNRWVKMAKNIPDEELRSQALDSLNRKEFHCEGGGVYGLLAKERMDELIEFIVAYQIICDYLDNLCDRSTSLDPADFRLLHEALIDALTPGSEPKNYYELRDEQDDGGYLHALVKTCQQVLATFPSFEQVQEEMLISSGYYGDLQVHKHVIKEERVPRLEAWFEEHRHHAPEMTWFEFSACTGSTLGIFALAAYATKPDFTKEMAATFMKKYFTLQGVHIMMDYFIDQDEDIADGELNFVLYYENEDEMIERFQFFLEKAEAFVLTLPDPTFHRMILRGLISIYISDEKVQKDKDLKKLAKKMIKMGGWPTLIFYLNSWIFRRKR